MWPRSHTCKCLRGKGTRLTCIRRTRGTFEYRVVAALRARAVYEIRTHGVGEREECHKSKHCRALGGRAEWGASRATDRRSSLTPPRGTCGARKRRGQRGRASSVVPQHARSAEASN